jgi:hypothetical protein
LCVQGKHTPEKKERKNGKKRKEERVQKKPKITPKTLKHQIQMAPTKNKKPLE